MADKTLLEKAPKMSIFQTSLALISANVGGGMLGIPFAFYHLGLFLGLICVVIAALLSHYANVMYLKVKDLTPRRYESVYEIAYLLTGRPSIFVVCSVMLITNFTASLLFYMVLGETISSLCTQVLIVPGANETLADI